MNTGVNKNIDLKTITIIGLGLIGGSMALRLKKNNPEVIFLGVDANQFHAKKAFELGLVQEIVTLEEGIEKAELIILAVPVNVAVNLLPEIMPLLNNKILMDAGSTKQIICNLADTLPNRNRFVASHPMWGTEFSGPEAATENSFTGTTAVICNSNDSAPDALQTVQQLYLNLGMRLMYMQAADHDLHAAYISHVSHISSFALANTVLKKEKEDRNIFEMASAGFESTVRLAKSNEAMWVPIFLQNQHHVVDVLSEHIKQLILFKESIETKNEEQLKSLITQANKIKRILK